MTVVVGGVAGVDHHDTGEGHPERQARVGAVMAGIHDSGLDGDLLALPRRLALRSDLVRVHSEAYVDALERFCTAGGGHLDPDTPAVAGSWETALTAAGAGLEAVDALERGDGEIAFVVARPPGHHATASRAMGFCLLNNAAVTAGALAARGERVMIVDWDVHHGNGTQDIFWDRPDVLYFSTHQSPHYPGTGGMGETGGLGAPGTTLNVPLPAGSTGDAIRRALDELAAPAAEEFRPGWILVSAGFDAHRDDPLADLELTSGDFADIARRVAELAPAPRRLVLFLEGGYDLGALQRSVGATLAALGGADYRPEAASSGGPGTGVVDAIKRFRQRHREEW
ncbi:MAG: histone deacetylase [Acidimicrobiales bacterium]